MTKSEYIDMKYDEEFKSNTKLTWFPFVGKNYETSNPKWLIVGESHYLPTDEEESSYIHKEWTREFILKDGIRIAPWYDNEVKNNLTREIEKTLFNKLDSSCWNFLAYYNLIQRLLPNIAMRPTYGDIVEGLNTFTEVITILKPNKVVFCGVEAGKHFEFVLKQKGIEVFPIELDSNKINGTYPKRFDIKLNDLTICCLFIKHPSMGYTAELWRKYINEM